MVIKPSETRTHTIKDRTVRGFSFKFIGKLNAGVAAPATTVFDLSKVIVNANLKRDGRNIVIFNDILLPLAMESSFRNSAYSFTQSLKTTSPFINLDNVTPNALKLVPVNIDLGAFINIKGDDELSLQVILQPGAFVNSQELETGNFQNGVDLGRCFLEFDEIEGIGIETKTPQIVSKAISAGESRLSESLGNNVDSIMFVNLETSEYLPFHSPIQTVQLASDRYNYNDNLNELIAKRLQQFTSIANATERGHSFILHEGPVELDKVKLDLSLQSNRIFAGRNFIVYRTFEISAALLDKANQKAKKHLQYDLSKVN